LDFITPDVGNSQSSTLTTPSSRDLFQPRRVWSYVRALAPSFWTWSDRWPEIGYLLGRYAWALHGNSDRLITPEDPLLPGEWFKVQVAGVRLEDAARLRWVWVKSGDERVEIESGGIMLDPELEGLLRVKLKAPVFEPGTGLWIGGLWPEEGVSSSFSPLPTGEPATQP
jgi:hypothetical protein